LLFYDVHYWGRGCSPQLPPWVRLWSGKVAGRHEWRIHHCTFYDLMLYCIWCYDQGYSQREYCDAIRQSWLTQQSRPFVKPYRHSGKECNIWTVSGTIAKQHFYVAANRRLTILSPHLRHAVHNVYLSKVGWSIVVYRHFQHKQAIIPCHKYIV